MKRGVFLLAVGVPLGCGGSSWLWGVPLGCGGFLLAVGVPLGSGVLSDGFWLGLGGLAAALLAYQFMRFTGWLLPLPPVQLFSFRSCHHLGAIAFTAVWLVSG